MQKMTCAGRNEKHSLSNIDITLVIHLYFYS